MTDIVANNILDKQSGKENSYTGEYQEQPVVVIDTETFNEQQADFFNKPFQDIGGQSGQNTDQ